MEIFSERGVVGAKKEGGRQPRNHTSPWSIGEIVKTGKGNVNYFKESFLYSEYSRTVNKISLNCLNVSSESIFLPTPLRGAYRY
jgi:hypothetical protein